MESEPNWLTVERISEEDADGVDLRASMQISIQFWS